MNIGSRFLELKPTNLVVFSVAGNTSSCGYINESTPFPLFPGCVPANSSLESVRWESLCTFLQLSQSDSGWTNRMRFWLSYESGKCKRHYILCNFRRGIDLRYAEVLETTGSHRKTHPKSHCVQVALRVFDILATEICDQKVYNLVDALLGFDQFERSGTGRK